MKHSIGTRTTDRPLLPIEVSDTLNEIMKNTGNNSYEQLGKRFDVSAITIKQFIDLQKAPKRFRDIWDWGQAKNGKIAWSQFREACNFFHKKIITEEEFGILVNGVLENKIKPDDIREIVRLKKKNPDKLFTKCCEEILNLIPETIKMVVFISDLDSNILKNIRKKANEKSISDEDESQHVLSECVGAENVEGVMIKDDKYIKIAFTDKGRKNLDNVMKEHNETMKTIINHIFRLAGYDDE